MTEPIPQSDESTGPEITPEILRSELEQKGYLHLPGSRSLEQFLTLASSLGDILQQQDIRLDPHRTDLISRPDSMPYHTDDIGAEFVAWHCLEQDDEAGQSQLLDTSGLTSVFTPEELQRLSTIQLHRPRKRKPNERAARNQNAPLLTPRGNGYRVYYLSWPPPETEGSEKELLFRFQEYLKALEAAGPISIRLQPGESLLIDNGRMLHGRGKLGASSRRHLVRLWIGDLLAYRDSFTKPGFQVISRKKSSE